jgi:hypothetical protein
MTMKNQRETTICPLCHRDNGCMMHESDRCWCMDITVPQGLIDLVPPELQRQACICRSCIDRYKLDPAGFSVVDKTD